MTELPFPSSPDPWPASLAHPEIACRRLGQLIAKEASRLTQERWQGTAVPTLQGAILFAFERDDQARIEWLWHAEQGEVLAALPGTFSFSRLDKPGSEKALMKVAAFVLSGVVRNKELRFLCPIIPTQNTFERRALGAAICAFLPSKSLSWYKYTLHSTQIDSRFALLTFKDGTASVTFRVDKLSNYDEMSDPKRQPIVWRGMLIEISISSDTREPEFGLEAQVERAVVFVFRRFEQVLNKLSIHRYFLSARSHEQTSFLLAQNTSDLSSNEAWWNLYAEREIRDAILLDDIDQSGDVWLIGVIHAFCVFADYPFDLFGPSIACFHRGIVTRKHLLHTTHGVMHEIVYVNEGNVAQDGGLSQWKSLLEKLDKEATPDTLIVSAESCFNKLIGYTLNSPNQNHYLNIKAACASAVPGAAMYTDNEEPFFITFSALMSFSEPCPRTDEPSINLIGFPSQQDCAELISEMEKVGVHLNSRLFPQAYGKDARRFQAAWAQYWLPGKYFVPNLFGKYPVPVISAKTPCGFAGTLNWLETIAHTLGTDALYEQFVEEKRPYFEERLAFWREKTTGITIGFVADIASLTRLWDPWRNNGITLLPLLLEFGFKIAIYYHDDQSSDYGIEKVREYLEKLLPTLGLTCDNISMHGFSTRENFNRLLLTGPATLFFSDWHSVPAVVLAGHSVFSLDDIERGFAGAERTMQRLTRRRAAYWQLYRDLYNPLVIATHGLQGASE